MEKPSKENSDKPIRNFEKSVNDLEKPIKEFDKDFEKPNKDIKDINKVVTDLDLDKPKTQIANTKENEDLESKSLLERVRLFLNSFEKLIKY